MKKIITLIVVLPILLVVAASALFLALFDANEYKSELEQAVLEQTGRKLSFKGDAELMLYPDFGMKLGALSFANAKGFGKKPMLAIEKVSISVDIPSIFKMKPVINELILNGLLVDLQINKKGVSNWQDLVPKEDAKMASQSAEDKASIDSSSSANDTRTTGVDVSFKGINIKNAKASWKDALTGDDISIDDLDIKTGSIALNKSFPVAINLLMHQQKNINAHLTINTNLLLNLDDSVFTMKDLMLQLKAHGEQFNNQQVAVDLSGQFGVKNFSQPAITFDLTSTDINLDALLGLNEPVAEGQPVADQAQQAAATDVDTEIVLPMQMMRELDIDGVIKIDAFQAMNLKTQNNSIKIIAKKGVLEIAPMQTQLYQGALVKSVKVDVSKKQPIYHIDANLSAVQIKPLLVDLLELDKIRGAATIAFDVSTTGTWLSHLKSNLNGKMNMRFQDGAIAGLNLRQKISEAKAKLKKDDSLKTEEKETDFSELTLSGKIINGVFKSNDLSMKSPLIRVTGQGFADLNSSTLDYTVNAKLVDSAEGQASNDEKMKSLLIPVNISGPFSQPKINILLDDMLKSSLKKKLAQEKEKLNALKQQAIDKKKAALQAKQDELQAKQNKLKAEKERLEAEEKAKIEAKKKALADELAAKKQAKKDKAKEAAKKKLKNLF